MPPAADAATEPAPSLFRLPAATAALTGGCALLVLRPPLLRATSSPVAVLVSVFALVGVVGAWWPLSPAGRPDAVGDRGEGGDGRRDGDRATGLTLGLALLLGVGGDRKSVV